MAFIPRSVVVALALVAPASCGRDPLPVDARPDGQYRELELGGAPDTARRTCVAKVRTSQGGSAEFLCSFDPMHTSWGSGLSNHADGFSVDLGTHLPAGRYTASDLRQYGTGWVVQLGLESYFSNIPPDDAAVAIDWLDPNVRGGGSGTVDATLPLNGEPGQDARKVSLHVDF